MAFQLQKSYAYAQYEGLAQMMREDPQLCHVYEYAYPSAVGPTGDILDLAVEFPAPRTPPGRGFAIDEAWYLGMATGASITGVPVVARLPSMTSTFCIEFIFNQGSKIRHMTGGQVGCPMVVWQDAAGRSFGRAGGSAGQHTDVGQEALYANLAGVKIVAPSNAYDAKGLMIAAIRDPDPVIYFDYRDVKSGPQPDVPDEIYEVPIGKAAVEQEGTDLTIVTWAPAIVEVRAALPEIEEAGISAEVVDLRSIKPMDVDTVLASVEKTGRVLAVTHAHYTNSVASHVVAEVAQKAPGAKAKIIAFPDAPGPFASTMMVWMRPDAQKIALAAQQMMEL
jgi:pyruvate dehydrogenase E1 component beta subunit